jgi:hypothetical protein
MIVYESIYELIVRYYQITGDTQNGTVTVNLNFKFKLVVHWHYRCIVLESGKVKAEGMDELTFSSNLHFEAP